MKKSLLLIGLAMLAGLATSAQAATLTHRSHVRNAGAGALATALGLDSGLLSAIDDLLSGNRQAVDQSARHCGCEPNAAPAHRQPGRLHPPGPATAAPMSGGPLIPTSPASAERDTPESASDGAHAPVDGEPDLGWQSLLPGSIQ
ncbi:MAG TPA: hypothetical protein VFJ15_13485 [Oleiagrimonas sp.]|nr:hypothetical protein [Oleiagrimonas sp.]